MIPLNPRSDAPAGARTNRNGLWLALVLTLSCGVFAPTLLNGFTFDDPHYARAHTPTGDANPMVAELRPFAEYWQKPMNWGLPTNCRGFRPVTVYSYALVNAGTRSQSPSTEDEKSGENTAFFHHLLNLVLHTAATLLVFLLVRSLMRTGPALVASLVFGVHALHSGPVAAIVGRAEILSFSFGAAASLLYTAGLLRTGRSRAWRLPASSALLMLSFGAKESALAWAAFLPIFASVRGVAARDQLVAATLAIGIPLASFLVLRSDMLATHVAPRGPFWVEHDANPLFYMHWIDRVINATPILLYSLCKVIFPTNLSSNYGDGPFTIIESLFHWRFLASSFVLLALLIGGLRLRRRAPPLFLAVAAFFGFSFITSNIPFPIETIFGDRLLYTAVLGLSIGVAWVAARMPKHLHRFALVCLGIFVTYNSWLSVERSLAWHDNMSLTSADLLSQPGSVGLHVDMGNLHLWNFDTESAEREFRAAVRIRPRSPRALRFLAEHSEPDLALTLLRRALRADQLVEATEGRRIHWALAQIHENAGRTDEAWSEYEAALACNPYVPDIRLHMLRETSRRGDFDRFATLLEEGRTLDPDNRYFAMYHGVLLHHRKEYDAAAKTLEKALVGLPHQALVIESWFCLADSLLHLNRREEARQIALRFSRGTGKLTEVRRVRERILQGTADLSKPAGPPR